MKKLTLFAVTLLFVASVFHCGGGSGGGGEANPVDPPVDPGSYHFITGTITSPSGWGSILVFDVRHEGTRDTGDFASGAHAEYPCDNVQCDCIGTCTYTIAEYNGTYVVTVWISSAYGDYVSTPLSRPVVVSGADTAGHDFELNIIP